MILLYMHSGAYNHGCEAIVRSICDLYPNEKIVLLSSNLKEDLEFKIDKIVKVIPVGKRFCEKSKFHLFIARLGKILFKNSALYWKGINDNLKPFLKNITIALSIGGDNYCYNISSLLSYQNNFLKKRKIKTVLYGASINSDSINKRVLKDLRKYTLITARETSTYNLLKSYGLSNVERTIDSAFFLSICDSKYVFDESKKYIGINLSPLIFNYCNNKTIVKNSFLNLINHILQTTQSNILLIPHVSIPGNDDLSILKDYLCLGERISIVSPNNELNCCQLKHVISHCEFLIACRTHASIAAYSSCVPCLVVGYSIKSIGIATDLFGTSANYVINCKDINPGVLIQSFDFLYNKRKEIRLNLETNQDEYKKKIYNLDISRYE